MRWLRFRGQRVGSKFIAFSNTPLTLRSAPKSDFVMPRRRFVTVSLPRHADEITRRKRSAGAIMARSSNRQRAPQGRSQKARKPADGDGILRPYMVAVYARVAGGMALSGLMTLLFTNSGYAAHISETSAVLKYATLFAPMPIIVWLTLGSDISPGKAGPTFWLFSVLLGLSLSTLAWTLAQSSIEALFFAIAAAFALLSAWIAIKGKRPSALATFLVMALPGTVSTSLIVLMLQSSAGEAIVGFLGLFLFSGLAAISKEWIEDMYDYTRRDNVSAMVAQGALAQYVCLVALLRES